MKKADIVDYLRRNPDALRDEGFKIRRDVPTVRKTFEVEPEVVDEFMAEARRRKLKIKEAIDQALRAWLTKSK